MASQAGQQVPVTSGGPARERRAAGRSPGEIAKRFLTLREGSITIVTIVTAIYFGIRSPVFFSSANLQTILPYFAPIAILAAGEVFLMINGEIDLSIGAVYLFAPFLFYEIHGGGIGLLLSFFITILACMVIGLANGLFTEVLGVTSFITTLGMMFTIEGFSLIISHAAPVEFAFALPTSTAHGLHIPTFASIFGEGVYSELVWALVIVFVLQVVLSRMRHGLYTVAVGSNRLGASEAGVRVRGVVIRNFILCSSCAGLVGILEAMRTTGVQPDTAGAGEILFSAISAAVIGGTLLAGGSGTVVGALIGALFIGILQDGLVLLGVNADYEIFFEGLAILFAMSVNVYVGRIRRGSGLG